MEDSKFELMFSNWIQIRIKTVFRSVFIYSNAEMNRFTNALICEKSLFWSWFPPSVFSTSFFPFFLSFSPLFQLKSISVRERGKACQLLYPPFSHPLSFLFTFWNAPDRVKAQPRRLLLCSLTNFDSKRRRVKLICLPFIFLGDTVILDYVMFLKCTLWNRSAGRSSPATAVYIPQRQTRARLSGEKLSTLVLIWLCVYCFCRMLENCSRRLVSV